MNQIDYRQLLAKYIKVALIMEGTDLILDCRRCDFPPEELDELKKIVKEIEDAS